MAVLVWIEQSGGEATASSWEALGKGREVADQLGTSLTALVMGADTAAAAEQAQQYGADTVLTMNSPLLENYRASVYTDVLKEAINQSGANVILTSATIRGRELSAAAACDCNAGLAADVIDLRVDDGKVVGVRTAYSGNILADITFESDQQFVSVRPRAFPMPEAGAASGTVEEMNVVLSLDDIPEKVTDVRAADTSEISLGDADRICSGGGPQSMRAISPTSTKWVRQAKLLLPTSTLRLASAVPSSTWPVWAPVSSLLPSTKMVKRPFSSGHIMV